MQVVLNLRQRNYLRLFRDLWNRVIRGEISMPEMGKYCRDYQNRKLQNGDTDAVYLYQTVSRKAARKVPGWLGGEDDE